MSVFATDLLAGRKALVTGGGTGIGKGIAAELAGAGADVVIAARRVDVLEAAADELSRLASSSVEVAELNIRDPEMVGALADAHPDVTILVNCAGGHFAQRAREFSPNGWRSVIDLNLTGTWNMTQAFGDRMLAGDGGVICQIVMEVGRGLPGLAHSAAARAGVVELTRTLAYEWGPKVRINAVAPGQIRTPAWDETYEEGVGGDVGEQPLGYEGSIEDVATAVTFLVSPAARYITGQLVNVDGGLNLRGLMSALPEGGYPERREKPSGR